MLSTHKHKIHHFDHRIEIEEPTETTTNAVTSVTWSEFIRRWAKFDIKGSNSSNEGEQEVNVIKRLYVVRYDSESKNITAKMRVVDDSQNWYITGIEKNRREGYINIYTELRD